MTKSNSAPPLKPRSPWWTVAVVDPLTMGLLPWVVRIPGVTPMRITGLAILIGAGGIVAFGSGALVVGAVLYELHYLLDCLDGKVARATRTSTAWGRFVDLASDGAITGGSYAALGYWMLRQEAALAGLVLPLLVSFGVASWLHLYRRLELGEDERTSKALPSSTRVWSFRRMRPYPGSVEVETTLLFFFPLIMPAAWYGYVVAAAVLFYTASAIDSVRRVRRTLSKMPAES